MSDSIRIGQLYSGSTLPPVKGKSASGTTSLPANNRTFKEWLDDSSLKFSHHAETRIRQRGIELKPDSLAKISNAVEEANRKGAVNSLILYQDIAMIVNVPSRTVVTAMDGGQMANNVFTQIDSAVIVKEGRT